jgi:hypothetical protein
MTLHQRHPQTSHHRSPKAGQNAFSQKDWLSSHFVLFAITDKPSGEGGSTVHSLNTFG